MLRCIVKAGELGHIGPWLNLEEVIVLSYAL